MTDPRRPIFAFLGPYLKGNGWNDDALREGMDRHLDLLGVARESPPEPAGTPAAPNGPTTAEKPWWANLGHPAAPQGPLTGLDDLRARLGVADGADLAPALFAKLTNLQAPAITEAEFAAAALDLGVSVKLIKAVRNVEAPRGPFDEQGRPSILYEKHVFSRNSGGRFDASHPELSADEWQPGTYGPFSVQYPKLARACALDPEAAFKACSWGAFQVLGENAEALGYPSAFDMALALTRSEAAHLDSFVRFVKVNGLVDELRQCKPGDPSSCVDFVSRYNGSGYRKNAYHLKLAEAMR